mgnify:CR=1 FL=1
MVSAAALANLHPEIGIYLGVYLLPLRHPVPVARQLANLAEMAPGRISFGIGVGGDDRHEVEVCGVVSLSMHQAKGRLMHTIHTAPLL